MKIVGLTTGGHDFHIKIMEVNGAEIHKMGKGISRFINEFFRLPDADVYITESNFYAPIIVKKIFQRKKIKVVNIAGSRFIFQNTNFLLNWIINKIDLILVEGLFGEEGIRKVGYKGKTQIIYPGFNIKQSTNKNNKSKKLKIVTIARFDWKMKGLDILEKAICDIDCEVNVIGESNYKSNSNKIKILGKVSEKKLNEIFQESNLYIQPSRFDTFGIAVLEAAYSGLPVIVSDNCGVKEFVNENYVFKDSKELNKILKRNKFENTFKFEKYEKMDKNIYFLKSIL